MKRIILTFCSLTFGVVLLRAIPIFLLWLTGKTIAYSMPSFGAILFHIPLLFLATVIINLLWITIDTSQEA